jgi:hypothetical protein
MIDIQIVRVLNKASGYAKDFTFRDNNLVHEELLTPEDMGNDEEEDDSDSGRDSGDWDYDE